MPHEILLYYRYTAISDPKAFAAAERERCQRLDLKGRIIVGKEGLNGTVEGTTENTQTYIDELVAIPHFAETHFKRSPGTGTAFPRLSIKVREEIVSGHLGPHDVNPSEVTGKYIYAEELYSWIHGTNGVVCSCHSESAHGGGTKNPLNQKQEGSFGHPFDGAQDDKRRECLLSKTPRELYLVDMRNDYEHKIGRFDNSILPPLKNFRDLPKVLPILKHLKNKTIVTVCTGGVRCEKASGFLVKNGFTDVYQLYGGIVTYMEKYPEEDFKGKLYVFDGRITVGFNSPTVPHEIIGRCDKCNAPSERYVNCSLKSCNAHFICCSPCQRRGGELERDGVGWQDNTLFCSTKCTRDFARIASGKKLWFKAKRYGYGWTPATWQGWLVVAGYLALIAISFWYINSQSHSASDTLINFIPQTIILTTLLLATCYWRGEQPRWRWGK